MMKWLKTKSVLLLLLVASLCLTLAGSAYAFDDIRDDREKSAIESLYKKGIVNGVGKGKFLPKGTLTVGNAVALIVKGMDLNIDHHQFVKKPKASDYFTKIQDNAWYAQAFIVAHHHNLGIPKDINPNAKATREQFAHWLYNAISTKGDYAFIEIYLTFKDENKVNPDYMNSIQKLLIAKIAALDENNTFRPQEPITRSEAAGMLHRAIEFVKNMKPVEPVNPEFGLLTDVKLVSEKVNDEILKVTVSGMAPHPGYGLEISDIRFHGGQADIGYRLVLPDPSAFYAQVITEVKAVTYVPAAYKPVLGMQAPAEMRKQETDQGTKLVPIEPSSSPAVSDPLSSQPAASNL